jgi:peptide/nickel transport system substrate-binding protein
MRIQRTMCLILTFAILAFSLVGCGSTTKKELPSTDNVVTEDAATDESAPTPEVTVEDKTGDNMDVLKVAVADMPTTLDVGTSVTNALGNVVRNIFDTIMTKDANGELTSELCESWENIDATTYEFKLKEGITFQNGQELTAEDVEYSVERVLFGDTSYFNPNLSAILVGFKDVEVLDTYTFRIIMEKADPVLFERVASEMGIYVVPKGYVEEVGDVEFGLNPIGTGPYKVVEFTPNKIVMEYYEGFYGEKPVAERVEYYCYPEVSTRLAALFSGEVDIVLGLTPENVEQAKSNGFNVSTDFLDWNYLLTYNSSVEPMDDPLIRKALNLAIDRQALVDYVWLGNAEVSNGYNFKGYGDYYVADFPEYEYDVEQAKELLAQSSYNGETINYELKSGYYTLGNEVAEAIVSMWRDIGVDAQIRYNDAWDWEFSQVHNWSNAPRYLDPTGGLLLLWGEDTNTEKYFWQNEETWDEYIENAETLLYSFDFDERYAANKRMMELWEDECVGTVLFNISEIYAYRKDLEMSRVGIYPDFRIGQLSISK